MEFEQESIANIRAKYEQVLMDINGVVLVSDGLSKSGRPCLKIGTSVPVEEIRSEIPEELFEIEVELEYIGDIRAQ